MEEEQYWQEVGVRWQATRRQRLWRRHNDRVVRDLLERWLGSRAVGCVLKTDLFEEAGHPGLASLLQQRANLMVGIDVSGATARSAYHRHAGIQVIKTDVRQLPFAPASFDVVVSTSTLDHFHTIDELQRAFSELARTLKVGGELLLTLDNLDNPVVRVRNGLPFSWLRRIGLVPYYVGATCGQRDMSRRLRLAGFELLETTSVLHCPRAPAIALARWIERMPLFRGSEGVFLAAMRTWEVMSRLPSRFRTGYFVAARARKIG